MPKKLEAEHRAIARLLHIKNEFNSLEYVLGKFPVVEARIKKLLEAQGFTNNFNTKEVSPSPECFEIQTHNVSVEPHEDTLTKGVYFGVYCVKTKDLRIRTGYPSVTELYSSLGKQKQKHNMYEGVLCVFDPRQTHSMVFYGEETTFILFTVKRIKKVKVP